ncbi:MAG: hypothetical protein KME17_05590 [Cyanosarcina radialis HA8281-LM2]|jgi:hypothetical protein|nr:hypothetical protein [Cyanosarcina radialis HA8281-LM2]
MRYQLIYGFALLSLVLPINISTTKAQEIDRAATTTKLSQTRPDPTKPTEVDVGIYIIDFDDLDERDESFKLDAYLFLTWKDRRLAFKPTQPGLDTKEYKIGEIWSPQVRFVNIELGRETAYNQIQVKSDGTVYYRERFNGTFNSEMNLKRFPFDRQQLKLVLESPLNDKSTIAFTVDDNKTGKSEDAFLTGWTLEDYRVFIVDRQFDVDPVAVNRYVYEIGIARSYNSYIWNIILPSLFIIGVSWTVFWSRSFESNVAISFSSLLSAIAFNIVIAEELPKVAYLTWINGFISIGYIFLCLSIVQIVIKHNFNVKKKEERSEKLDRRSRWIFPIAFGISNVLLIAIFML